MSSAETDIVESFSNIFLACDWFICSMYTDSGSAFANLLCWFIDAVDSRSNPIKLDFSQIWLLKFHSRSNCWKQHFRDVPYWFPEAVRLWLCQLFHFVWTLELKWFNRFTAWVPAAAWCQNLRLESHLQHLQSSCQGSLFNLPVLLGPRAFSLFYLSSALTWRTYCQNVHLHSFQLQRFSIRYFLQIRVPGQQFSDVFILWSIGRLDLAGIRDSLRWF